MKLASTLAACLLLMAISGCFSCNYSRRKGHHHYHYRPPVQDVASSVAYVKFVSPLSPGNVTGYLTLSEDRRTYDGVKVVGYVMGLTPGNHGFHLHTFGDVKTNGCTSTGPHFNPRNVPHGGPRNGPDQRHVGDLGNIVADGNGVALVRIFDRIISLTGPESIYNRAIVVHAKADNFTPISDAGPRIACGTILKTKTARYH